VRLGCLDAHGPQPYALGMKLRHAAALALVGWYLMVPPSKREMNWLCGASLTASVSHELFGTGDEKEYAEWAKMVDTNARLSEWHEMSPFETLKACEEARGRFMALPAYLPEHAAQCVASDDPRLAK
jgi:hypothetical protein